MSRPLKVFITYSHRNTAEKDELITRLAVLKSEGKLGIWHDNEILPGDRWRDAISKNLADSNILLYLTSADSLASKNCNKELAAALYSELRIIPIILERCDWLNHQLSDFQALPKFGKPINEWEPESAGWQDVVDGIRKVVDNTLSQADSSSDTSQDELRAELAFQRGNFLRMIGQLDMAIDAYSEAVDLKSHYAEIYNNRGIAYAQKSDLENAFKDYNKAIEFNPNLTYAYNNRGIIYAQKGDIDNAFADYNKAISLEPNFSKPYNNRGILHAEQRNFAKAIKDYNKALGLQPNDAQVYSNRGNAYAEQRNFAKAIKNYNKAIELRPYYPLSYNNRGVAYAKNAKFDNAIADYNIALELAPDLVEGYYNRGLVRLILQTWGAAKWDLKKAKIMGMDIAASFKEDEGSIEDYKQKTGIQLPPDIAAMLTVGDSET